MNPIFERSYPLSIFAMIATLAGCAQSSPDAADTARADSALGEDSATSGLGPDAEPARADLPGTSPETSPDAPADLQAAREDLAGGERDAGVTGDGPREDLIPDGRLVEDARVPDMLTPEGGTREGPVADAATEAVAKDSADAGAGGDQGACTGWTTLVRLSPAELSDLMSKIDPIVINVHIPYEGDIPGTDTSIPYNKVDDIETYLHKDHCADVVLVCKSGGMSKTAGDELVKRGYLRVRDLDGGMQAWQAAGYPLLKDGGT